MTRHPAAQPHAKHRPTRLPPLKDLLIWLIIALLLAAIFLPRLARYLEPKPARVAYRSLVFSNTTRPLIDWLRANRSALGMPYSFAVPFDSAAVYAMIRSGPDTTPDILERIIVREGLVVYDGALWQMVLAATGDPDDFALAERPLEYYRTGQLGKVSVRCGRPVFRTDGDQPRGVKNKGYIFKVIDANGDFYTSDPLDGKTVFDSFPNERRIHWEDWYPISGENAWVTMAALQIYHRKYWNEMRDTYDAPPDAPELLLARELAGYARLLQADNGGIRMGPRGTWSKLAHVNTDFWYDEISTENNFSWYTALGMLEAISPDSANAAMRARIADYLRWAFDTEAGVFSQGAHWSRDSGWVKNPDFAVDCQTWGLSALGPRTIDAWFGRGTAYDIWRHTRNRAGYTVEGRLLGVGFTDEHDQLSVEWTAGAILATRMLANYYVHSDPDRAEQVFSDCLTMREGVERLRTDIDTAHSAYSYSLRRKFIPFGWWAHDSRVLSTVSTAWIILMDQDYNPFLLGGEDEYLPQPLAVKSEAPPLLRPLGYLLAALFLVLIGVLIHYYRRISAKPHLRRRR